MVRTLLLILTLICAPVLRAQIYYVAPAPRGSPSGDGTVEQPWDLATALAGAAGRIQPGDTVWLTGGRYLGAFRTQLRGTPDSLIVFRQERGARATIDGTLRADGAYLAFWGFEIMQSSPVGQHYALEAHTNGGRFINLVIHDAGTEGVSFWTPGEDAELYGCVIYNNGTHDNKDHGVYVHNERGTKRLVDNVIFNNFAFGIHAYAASHNPPQRGFLIQGNIVFNNGTISTGYRAKGNIIVGGQVPYSAVDVSSNYLYYSGTQGLNLHLGYEPALSNEDVVARDNVMWGGRAGVQLEQWLQPQIENNVWLASPAETSFVVVRANRYERGRAYIVAYHADSTPALKADLSAVLRPGDVYELRSVQDLFGPALASGTYAGGGDSVALPISAPLPAPQPIGRPTRTPPVTRPVFDVFVVETRAETH